MESWCSREKSNLQTVGFEPTRFADLPTRAEIGVPRRIRTPIAFFLKEAPLPIGLPGHYHLYWCCVVASIHVPPRYQPGALPNELTQQYDVVPLRGIKPRSAAYKAAASSAMLQGLRASRRKLEPAGGIKPPSHPYEGRVLSLNHAGDSTVSSSRAERSDPQVGGLGFWIASSPFGLLAMTAPIQSDYF